MNEMIPVKIRRAELDDAAAVCDVLHRSITELCARDHHNDPLVLSSWLENKTEQNMRAWLGADATQSIVAVHEQNIVGVGMIGDSGEIHLCYVLPEVLHHNVGKQLLDAMLKLASAQSHSRVSVVSTGTGKPFYERNGFKLSGEPEYCLGVLGYPMMKDI